MANVPLLPLIVAELHASKPDINYQLYGAAYGLEMQIDNEWKLDVVLLTPSRYLTAVTQSTGVTGSDVKIVSAGVTDVPVGAGGKPDLSELGDEKNNWLLIAGPKNTDSETRICIKLRNALLAKCRPILCFSDLEPGQLAIRLQGLMPDDLSRLVIAYIGPDATRPDVARHALQAAQQCVRSTVGSSAKLRFIVGGPATGPDAVALCAIPGLGGIFLPADDYSHFGDILDVLSALGVRGRK